jgi:hypothetical protein
VGDGGEMAQTMCTHMSKYTHRKRRAKKKITIHFELILVECEFPR